MNLYDAYLGYLSQQERKRIEEQEKLFAYYNGNEDKIMSYLQTALNITFNSDDLLEFQKDYINITTKCIDQLSVVYRDPAKRELSEDSLDEYYNGLIPFINSADKQAHRYAKLANVSLTKAEFKKGKIRYRVLPSYMFNIKTDESDCYELTEVSYPYYFKGSDGKDELYLIVWTKDEHYRCPILNINGKDIQGDKEALPGSLVGIKNPYGVIPFATLRLKEQGDFWGFGQTDLINANEQINLLLTELINEHVLMGAAGTLLAVNCNLETKTEKGDVVPKKVRTGRKHPMQIDNVKDGEQPPSLDYVSTNPFILEMRELIDWKIKIIAISKGLNPNSFLTEVQATSGFSKIMDSLEQLELRRDDIEPCRAYEDERFEITKAINNYHYDTTDRGKYKLEKIPEDSFIKVDFAEIKPPKTIDEVVKETDYLIKYNLANVFDLKHEMNPDLNDKDIEEELIKNKEINDKFKPQIPTGINPQNEIPKG